MVEYKIICHLFIFFSGDAIGKHTKKSSYRDVPTSNRWILALTYGAVYLS